MGVGGEWSAEAQVAIVTGAVAVGTGLLGGLRFLVGKGSDHHFQAHERGWQRAAELEEEVRLLRIALHKATQRGNDGWTISEILSLAMPLPLEDRVRAVRQARMIAERSIEEAR